MRTTVPGSKMALWTVLLGSLCPLAAQQTAEPAEGALRSLWSDEALAELVEKHAAEALEDDSAVGFSVAVGLGESLVLERGFGYAELEHRVLAGPRTLFRIGSITKQFTAALVMRQVQAGRIDLDEDFTAYLPQFDPQGRRVTVRHLLTHTSGIQSYTDLGERWFDVLPLDLSDEELVALFEDLPFDFEPGTAFRYNNSAYYLLGMMLSEVAGKRYERLLERELLQPLGLERTRYDSHSAVIPDRAQGYEKLLFGLRNDRAYGVRQPGAAGGLIACAGDLVRWQLALVGGRIVDPESYAQMTSAFVLPDGESTGYGFGLRVGERAGEPCVSHGGGIFGFNSMLTHYPSRGLSLAVVSNGPAPAATLELAIALALFEGPESEEEAVESEGGGGDRR